MTDNIRNSSTGSKRERLAAQMLLALVGRLSRDDLETLVEDAVAVFPDRLAPERGITTRDATPERRALVNAAYRLADEFLARRGAA